MKPSRVTSGAAIAAAGVVGIAAVALCGLTGLARPKALQARLQSVESMLDGAGRTARSPGDAGAYGAGAVCRQAPGEAAEAAKRRIEAAAASAGLTLSNLTAEPGVTSPDEPLAQVRLAFETTGPYEATVMLLNLLAQSRPEIFADTVDLTPKPGAVALNFSGRLLCSTSARP